MRGLAPAGLLVAGLLAAALTASPAGAQDTWVINEVFTNAEGTQQFVELREAEGSGSEHRFSGLTISTTDWTCTFQEDLPTSQTANQFLLLGTADFATFGGTEPDALIPDGFVEPSAGDQINFAGIDMFFINAGQLPTDGVTSLHRDDGFGQDGPAAASPVNFVAGGAGLAIQCPEPGLALSHLAALTALAALARLRR